MKASSEQRLFDGTRRIDGDHERKRVRSIRNIRVDRGDVQDRGQLSVRTKDRCSATAQAGVARTEMLRTMDRHRPLLCDAGAYAIGPLDLFRPDRAHPDAPEFELAGPGRIAAIVDNDAI